MDRPITSLLRWEGVVRPQCHPQLQRNTMQSIYLWPIRFFWPLIFLLLTASWSPKVSAGWDTVNNSDTVFVFVHGIFSNSKKCWTAENGTYWPSLVAGDPRLGNPSIYSAEYYTDFDSGFYGIENAASELISKLSYPDSAGNKPVFDKKILYLLLIAWAVLSQDIY